MQRHRSLHPLSHQHHNGLALCVLAERALQLDPSDENVVRQADKAVARFDLEMANHFHLEESLLFPAILDELGPNPLVDRLIAEHRVLEQMVAELRETPTEAVLRNFYATLRTHIRAEENELFEQTQSRLAPETMARLGAEFEALAVRVCVEP